MDVQPFELFAQFLLRIYDRLADRIVVRMLVGDKLQNAAIVRKRKHRDERSRLIRIRCRRPSRVKAASRKRREIPVASAIDKALGHPRFPPALGLGNYRLKFAAVFDCGNHACPESHAHTGFGKQLFANHFHVFRLVDESVEVPFRAASTIRLIFIELCQDFAIQLAVVEA